MFGQPAAFYGGRMFCGVFGDGIAVRLSDPDLAAAMKAPGITPFEPMAGRAMTGWVMLTAPVVARRAVSARWVDRAWNWVQTAPPKGPRPSRPRTGSRAK